MKTTKLYEIEEQIICGDYKDRPASSGINLQGYLNETFIIIT